MNRWLIIPFFIFLLSCKEQSADVFFTPEKTKQYFREVKEICDRDNGELWGKNLYGPLAFIDRVSRKLISNQPDKEGLLKLKDGVYVGLFPKENMVTSNMIEFGGTRFAAVTLANTDDDFWIKSRAIRGLCHLCQESAGISPDPFNIVSMDKKESRLWLKLEWKALRKAILAGGEERKLAIRDALIFRDANRDLNPTGIPEITKFENYEGLTTFTYTLLISKSKEEFNKLLIENLDRVYSFPSYARSFGFIHGALYSTLLYDKGFDFKTIDSDTIDLSNKVKELYNIELPVICRDVAGSISMNYGIDGIYREEELRVTEIKESIHKLVSTFTEKPVVFLELRSPYFDFEPENIIPLDTLGTLYNSIRVSDNWGKLTLDQKGCLVSNNLKSLRISARSLKERKNHISGDGWVLMLNEGWELVKVDENYLVRSIIP